jgi:hypothetical protein
MSKRLVLAVVLSGVLACDASDETACVVHDDCWSSPISQAQGRCGPQVACIEGVCDAWCPDSCEVTDPDVNPCTEPGWICAPVDGSWSRCSPTEIDCETIDDCPHHRPARNGAWTCDDGICRFPGFSYLYRNP